MRLAGAEVRFTTVADGDFSDGADPAERDAAQQRVVALPWRSVHQVHGSTVVTAARAQEAVVDADAIVSVERDVALAVRTADCAPVAFASGREVVAVAHAGWRGLMSGVLAETVAAMTRMGADRIVAALGPCIHAECYEFSPEELDAVAERFGSGVRGVTSSGTPALDVPAAVRSALSEAGVELVHDEDVCTACSHDHWSHRARGDRERQATVVWLP